MKFDKNTISRQRFWVCLGIFVLVFTIGILTVKVAAGTKIKAAVDAYTKADKDIKSALGTDPKNQSFWDPWIASANTYKKHIDVVWKEAWDLQKNHIVFPSSEDVPLQKLWDEAESFDDWRKKFQSDAMTDARTKIERHLYKRQFVDLYKKMGGKVDGSDFDKVPLDRMLAPVEFKGGLEGFKVMMMPTLGGGGGGVGGVGGAGPNRVPGRPLGGQPMMGQEGQGSRNIGNFFNSRVPPLVEEVWYAQEDFWVKTEMLAVVKRTLDSVGTFDREEKGLWGTIAHIAEHPDRAFTPFVKLTGAPTTGRKYLDEDGIRFRNTSWELHLLIEKEDNLKGEPKYFISGNSTIRNVHPSHRFQAGTRAPDPTAADVKDRTKRPLLFRLRQKGRAPAELRVKVEDLAWNARAEIKETQEFDPNFVDLSKPFDVEQVFDWSTAPVRRIDDIRTCVHSHRDANVPLKPHPVFSKPDAAAGAPTPAPAPMAPNPMPMPMPSPMGGAALGDSGALPTENNGLERSRYLNATGTCRDLPFALVVVCEQPHINDILVQLANSHLRVQITQWQVTRVRNVAQSDEGGRVAGPGAERFGPGAGGATGDPYLVELTVYGIAAMYEKFNMKKLDAPAQP